MHLISTGIVRHLWMTQLYTDLFMNCLACCLRLVYTVRNDRFATFWGWGPPKNEAYDPEISTRI